ncbi:hypothetical protein D3C71_1195820 [compost metagenome]
MLDSTLPAVAHISACLLFLCVCRQLPPLEPCIEHGHGLSPELVAQRRDLVDLHVAVSSHREEAPATGRVAQVLMFVRGSSEHAFAAIGPRHALVGRAELIHAPGDSRLYAGHVGLRERVHLADLYAPCPLDYLVEVLSTRRFAGLDKPFTAEDRAQGARLPLALLTLQDQHEVDLRAHAGLLGVHP